MSTSTNKMTNLIGSPQAPTAPMDPLTEVVTRAQAAVMAAEQALTTAQTALAAATETAIPLALRHRDMVDLVRLGIVASGSQDVIAAEASFTTARRALEQARTVAQHCQQARASAVAARSRADGAMERQRRRQWAEEQYPAVAAQLLAAQQEAGRLQTNVYAATSAQAHADLQALRRRIAALDAQLEQLAQQAPSTKGTAHE